MLKCKQRGKYLIIVISVHVLSLTLWVIRVHSHNVVLHTSENIFTATRSCHAHTNTETNKSRSISHTHTHSLNNSVILFRAHGSRMCIGPIPKRRHILSEQNRWNRNEQLRAHKMQWVKINNTPAPTIISIEWISTEMRCHESSVVHFCRMLSLIPSIRCVLLSLKRACIDGKHKCRLFNLLLAIVNWIHENPDSGMPSQSWDIEKAKYFNVYTCALAEDVYA